jgi:cytochrome c-type protein NapC
MPRTEFAVQEGRMPETQTTSDARKGLWSRLRGFLFVPSTRYSLFTLLGVGVVIGVAGLLGFETAQRAIGTNEFCSGCHANDAAKEWRESVHHDNHGGFVASCSDCHVPREFVPKMVRNAKSVKEMWSHLAGVIDTREKYEAHRPAMAETEWNRLRGNGARECRNCHDPGSMVNKDKPHVAGVHKSALAGGQVCIDCHKGVAHRAPGQTPAAPGPVSVPF